jgi:hypothetical protein
VRGHTADLHVRDLHVVDSFQIFGTTEVPAVVSFDIHWDAGGGRPLRDRPGSSDPADPTNFEGMFRESNATATFTVREERFEARGQATNVWSELGRERNGSLLHGGGALQTSAAGGLLAVRATPNPAAAGSSIDFTLAHDARVSLDVYDVLGRRIATLATDVAFTGGTHTLRWDLRGADGRRVPAGMYLVRGHLGASEEHARLLVMP